MRNDNSPEAPVGAAGVGWRARWLRVMVWLPGLIVAICAAAATAHGLFEVAHASGMPAVIAGLYPVITDGLAITAYVATARLTEGGRAYAWTVVVLAAGLSGVAQASYLADSAVHAPLMLRAVIGAWPAIAAAIVAHLLFLIAQSLQPSVVEAGGEPVLEPSDPDADAADGSTVAAGVQAFSVQPTAVQPNPVRPCSTPEPVPAAEPESNGGEVAVEVGCSAEPTAPLEPVPAVAEPVVESPARDRAEAAGRAYLAEHGRLPTVSRLMQLAEVSRGTAAEALKPLRAQASSLHLIDATSQPSNEEATP